MRIIHECSDRKTSLTAESIKCGTVEGVQIPSVYKSGDLQEIKMQSQVFSAGINGYAEEDLLRIVRDRIEYYQSTDFSCVENVFLIESINSALLAISERKKERKSRNVYSKDEI